MSRGDKLREERLRGIVRSLSHLLTAIREKDDSALAKRRSAALKALSCLDDTWDGGIVDEVRLVLARGETPGARYIKAAIKAVEEELSGEVFR